MKVRDLQDKLELAPKEAEVVLVDKDGTHVLYTSAILQYENRLVMALLLTSKPEVKTK